MAIAITDLPASAVIDVNEGTQMCQVFVPVKTITSPNSREHPMARHRRVRDERAATRRALLGKMVPPLPVRVTFVRCSTQLADDDNLPTAAKAIRDEIAKLYGVSDGPSGPITWDARNQERCKRGGEGVRVTIEHSPITFDDTREAGGKSDGR